SMSIHTGATCGEPSGISVTKWPKFLALNSDRSSSLSMARTIANEADTRLAEIARSGQFAACGTTGPGSGLAGPVERRICAAMGARAHVVAVLRQPARAQERAHVVREQLVFP